MSPPAGPLSGIRVVDLTTTFMGPYCTLMLAQQGADVIKVESPEGDIVRYVGTSRSSGMGSIFLATNQGKRSVALDLKRSEGRDALLRMTEQADVFITNMRPGAVARLGLGHAELAATNPQLIYCSLAGFGSQGPYREHAAYDDVIQAVSGLAWAQGEPGPPQYVRSSIADKIVGLMAAGAISSALFARDRTGQGQAIEVPMFESMTSFTILELQGGHVFDPPEGPVGYARTSSPHRRPYRTADGYLGVVIYTDRQWLSFFDLIGQPELAEDPRFRTITARTENVDELYQLVAASLPARTSDEWIRAFEAAGIPCTPVLGVDELFDDPHLREVEFFATVEHPSEGRLRLPRHPIDYSRDGAVSGKPAPRLGEHGAEVLAEFGFDAEEVRWLVDNDVLGGPDG